MFRLVQSCSVPLVEAVASPADRLKAFWWRFDVAAFSAMGTETRSCWFMKAVNMEWCAVFFDFKMHRRQHES